MPLAVFDLDGTLIDSRVDLADAANALIVERGGRPLPVEAIAGMVGEGAALLVRRALEAAALDAGAAEALPRFLELYAQRLLVHTRLYDGIADALDALDDLPLAILTNKPRPATVAILEGLSIADHFRWILGGDGPLPRKPDPESLRSLMSHAQASPAETVMIGDSPIDLFTARAAGTRAIIARYGFGFRDAEVQLGGNDLVADTAADLPALIRRAIGAGESGNRDATPRPAAGTARTPHPRDP
jgi:phosphoglycolate phosphatase